MTCGTVHHQRAGEDALEDSNAVADACAVISFAYSSNFLTASTTLIQAHRHESEAGGNVISLMKVHLGTARPKGWTITWKQPTAGISQIEAGYPEAA